MIQNEQVFPELSVFMNIEEGVWNLASWLAALQEKDIGQVNQQYFIFGFAPPKIAQINRYICKYQILMY